MFKHVHHVHYVARDRDAMMAYFEKNFDMKPEHVIEYKDRAIKEVLYTVGETTTQISEPMNPNSDQGKFLASSGPGLLARAIRW